MTDDVDPIDYLIEIRGVYDGWSIAVHKDGSWHNRWSDEYGNPIPGYDRQFERTHAYIREQTGMSPYDAEKPQIISKDVKEDVE